MISAVIAFLTALPSLVNGVNAFASKYFDTKVQLLATRLGNDTERAKAILTAGVAEGETRVHGLAVIASSKVLLFLFVGFALPYMLHEWQAIVYDKLWMHGATSTDPITGALAEWGNSVIYCLFGSSTAAGVLAAVSKWRQT